MALRKNQPVWWIRETPWIEGGVIQNTAGIIERVNSKTEDATVIFHQTQGETRRVIPLEKLKERAIP